MDLVTKTEILFKNFSLLPSECCNCQSRYFQCSWSYYNYSQLFLGSTVQAIYFLDLPKLCQSCGNKQILWLNIMTRIAWKFFFYFLHVQWGKSAQKVLIWFENVSSVWKLPVSKTERLLNLKFWLNPSMYWLNSAHIKPLNLELQRNWLAWYFH